MFELVFLCNLDNTTNERNLSYFQGLIRVLNWIEISVKK